MPSGLRVLNDSPVDCQTPKVTEPQRERGAIMPSGLRVLNDSPVDCQTPKVTEPQRDSRHSKQEPLTAKGGPPSQSEKAINERN